MGKRLLPVVLIALLLIMQVQLWFGRGSLTHVSELREELEQQKQSNEDARRKIEQLSAEVNDLKEGLNMVEERARSELGMVKPNEILVQLAK
ncbi:MULTISPECIES: cell division protein FtsB [unclassified Limnohabitans]|jgi:cell division protein FtsB|uniref:cell division protein FtsB n=1 Tax=unclassified Limnohabitans TaxID=2626134 RepID=UPI000A8A75BE|nr:MULTISPECIES: cell division protein FtsB [unclassified Limnohabitans]OYU12677.1 MAG: cell division protein FtsB [Comamonadaceae bacterium PBBC1]PUE18767.1 cell division protein FtsB [Limnohabitans sp. WS1]